MEIYGTSYLSWFHPGSRLSHLGTVHVDGEDGKGSYSGGGSGGTALLTAGRLTGHGRLSCDGGQGKGGGGSGGRIRIILDDWYVSNETAVNMLTDNSAVYLCIVVISLQPHQCHDRWLLLET